MNLTEEELMIDTDIRDYAIYEYSHWDDVVQLYLTDLLKDSSEDVFLSFKISKLIIDLSKRFREAGWEEHGNYGRIGLVAIPPYLIQDGYSTSIATFHVKQWNNGTSFLAMPHKLKLEVNAELILESPQHTHQISQ